MRAFAVALAVLFAATACSLGGGSSEGSYLTADCERADLHGHSVARVWDEALLDAIRRDIPAPTVHARNLFHTSAAMWDAWAAYDPEADGYFVTEKLRGRRRPGGARGRHQLRGLPGSPAPLLDRRLACRRPSTS